MDFGANYADDESHQTIGKFPGGPGPGGARSGKSRYGLSLAESFPAPRLFVATGEARDAEMAARIAAHQEERGPGWETREKPLLLPEALGEAQGSYGAILVDCLTMWLANLMLREDVTEADVKAAGGRLLAVLARVATPTIFISNEVGLGDCAGKSPGPEVPRLAGLAAPAGGRRRRPGGPGGGRVADDHQRAIIPWRLGVQK